MQIRRSLLNTFTTPVPSSDLPGTSPILPGNLEQGRAALPALAPGRGRVQVLTQPSEGVFDGAVCRHSTSHRLCSGKALFPWLPDTNEIGTSFLSSHSSHSAGQYKPKGSRGPEARTAHAAPSQALPRPSRQPALSAFLQSCQSTRDHAGLSALS